jgi:hypothetical protein|tara:strand:+ start:261 stop:584 length:324 start_codon:yes stop_codon:yes gene_type:complete
MFIYKITHNDSLLYVGSTINLAMRKHAHKQHRKQDKHRHLKLYNFLNTNNIPANELVYEVIEEIDAVDNKHLRYTEQLYINEYNPPCNHHNSMSLKIFNEYEENNII